MSVTDLARVLVINRNTVSRYLDMLLISGEVDMRTYGKAKVFYPSQRVPLSAMINFSSDGVVILDRDLTIVQANDRILEIVRAGRDDVIGKPIGESRLSAFDHPLIRARIEDALGGDDVVEEVRFLRTGGELFFRMKILPTAFNDGTPGITIILEDITRQKLSEEALRAEEAKFRALVEDINDIIWNVDDGWTFSYVSPKSFDLLGYAPDEMTGRSLLDFVPEAEQERLTEKLAGILDRHEAFSSLLIRLLHRNGRHLVFEASGTPDFDEIGEFAGFRMVSRDVTERHRAERRVRGWKSFLHCIVQNIPDMVFVREIADGAYVFFNRAAEAFVGGSSESLAGKQEHEIFRPEIIPLIACGEEEMRARQAPIECPAMPIVFPNGETHHLQTKKIPIAGDRGEMKYVLTIVRDITDHVRADALLADQRDLATALGSVSDLKEALSLCLGAATAAAGVDIAAVYAVVKEGALDRVAATGLSGESAAMTGRIEGAEAETLLSGRADAFPGEDGQRNVVTFAIAHAGTPVAVLVAASRPGGLIPAAGVQALETIAAQAANVAGRILAQETVRIERDLAERYLDVAGVMIAVIRTDGTIARMNRTGCLALGYAETEIVGKNWFETLVPAPLGPRLEANFRRLMDGSSPLPGEENGPLVTKDGQEIRVLWRNAIVRDDGGRITGLVTSGLIAGPSTERC
ncbi:MAG: hypothetical protein PWP08_505 [Methanofollis sp.]|nr:hypothetical protein [Methanofollis sp.]